MDRTLATVAFDHPALAGDAGVSVAQNLGHLPGEDGTARWVWPGATATATWLCDRADEWIRGKRVVELGAGTGLLGAPTHHPTIPTPRRGVHPSSSAWTPPRPPRHRDSSSARRSSPLTPPLLANMQVSSRLVSAPRPWFSPTSPPNFPSSATTPTPTPRGPGARAPSMCRRAVGATPPPSPLCAHPSTSSSVPTCCTRTTRRRRRPSREPSAICYARRTGRGTRGNVVPAVGV